MSCQLSRIYYVLLLLYYFLFIFILDWAQGPLPILTQLHKSNLHGPNCIFFFSRIYHRLPRVSNSILAWSHAAPRRAYMHTARTKLLCLPARTTPSCSSLLLHIWDYPLAHPCMACSPSHENLHHSFPPQNHHLHHHFLRNAHFCFPHCFPSMYPQKFDLSREKGQEGLFQWRRRVLGT